MIVSWNWLKQYVTLDMPHEELERRLMLSGLNHEGTDEVDGDLAIDLEVTSNRPDCLGHLGVAREVAVLYERELSVPAAAPAEGKTPIDKLTSVRLDCPELCYRYTARLVRGAKIGPSPGWMQRRLRTLGATPINNVVDISNYVLFECGQPLHAFDFGRLAGGQIVVRRPSEGEVIEAIDHREYKLSPAMCAICDAERPVAIGGVMGGAQTEISDATTDILVEAAEFDPVSIRSTARALNLHSDSSYRFERKIDPEGLDWASRRCCELILDLAGGELCQGMIDVGRRPPEREPVTLRLAQLERILGIRIPPERVRAILVALGLVEADKPTDGIGGKNAGQVRPLNDFEFTPPSWRRDLTREADLVEEVGRIHGYDEIPEDVGVPMVASKPRMADRVTAEVRRAMTAAGFDEAVTLSLLEPAMDETFSPWTDRPALESMTAVLRGANRLRRSVVPSLLQSRRENEKLDNDRIDLFEVARTYLPQETGLPREEPVLAATSGRDWRELKGVIEGVVAALNPAVELTAADADREPLDPAASCRLLLDGHVLAYLGRLTDAGRESFDLRGETTVAEMQLAPLVELADFNRRFQRPPAFPAIARDLNLVVDETVRWGELADTVRELAGGYFEQLTYLDTYRDPERLGPDKKSLLMNLSLRWSQGTMTGEQADELRDRIVDACRKRHGAELR